MPSLEGRGAAAHAGSQPHEGTTRAAAHAAHAAHASHRAPLLLLPRPRAARRRGGQQLGEQRGGRGAAGRVGVQQLAAHGPQRWRQQGQLGERGCHARVGEEGAPRSGGGGAGIICSGQAAACGRR